MSQFTDRPLISREELESRSKALSRSTSRIGEVLQILEDHDATEVTSELSEADQQAFACISIITDRILADVKLQFKGKQKAKPG